MTNTFVHIGDLHLQSTSPRNVARLRAFHQILFISHNEDLAGLADAQIRVADGKAEIVLPPFVQEAAA
jgi:hypothetical protein